MKFLTSLFRKFTDLPWTHAALDALTFRRLMLRLILIGIVASLLLNILNIPFMIMMMGVPYSSWAIAAALVIVNLWIFYNAVKLSMLRLRHLGMSGLVKPLALYGVVMLLSILPGVLALAGKPLPVVMAGLMAVPSMLLLACLFFKEKPCGTAKEKHEELNPFKPDTTGEKVGLFLLEAFIWFQVLSHMVQLVLAVTLM